MDTFSFGTSFPGKQDPLSGVGKIVTSGTARYNYYLQIVPTLYLNSFLPVHSDQYSVTENTQAIDFNNPHFKQPGIFFAYDFSPYTVTITANSA